MTDDATLLEHYFHRSVLYYTDRYTKYKSGNFFSFNIHAFLFSVFWFLYRKMYIEATTLFILIVGEIFVCRILFHVLFGKYVMRHTSIIILIIAGVITGFIADYLYMKKTAKIIAIAKAKFEDEEQIIDYIRSKGGVHSLFE